MANGVRKIDHPTQICEGCLVAKQARNAFPSQENFKAKHPLQLVHMDLCGPITLETPVGNRYFLLLVDDYSRMMWVYMIKLQSEAFGAFKKFKALIEKEVEHKIKVLRTDRGGEFLSQQFTTLCEEEGIQRHLTAPYTPQQNGVVERRNRTVLETARSLLKSMCVPANLWGEAVRHAVYILNRVPTKALASTTPYEAWTSRKPHLEHLRVFGCTAHVKVPNVHTKKLDDRSIPMVYLGVEAGSKAHRLYDPQHGKIHVSRDVVFEEERSWEWSEAEKGDPQAWVTFTVEEPINGDEAGVNHTDTGEQTSVTHDDATKPLPQGARTALPSSPLAVSMPASPPSVQNSPGSSVSSSTDDGPKNYRSLADIYAETEEVTCDDELLLLAAEEPTTYREAAIVKEWEEAMKRELEAIEKNKTWVLTELPPGHKPIGVKWVYKLKKDSEGNVVKHKARLVAKGYVQQQGIDVEEVFAPVTRMETVRLLLALAAQRGWEVYYLDVKSAFLNGDL